MKQIVNLSAILKVFFIIKNTYQLNKIISLFYHSQRFPCTRMPYICHQTPVVEHTCNDNLFDGHTCNKMNNRMGLDTVYLHGFAGIQMAQLWQAPRLEGEFSCWGNLLVEFCLDNLSFLANCNHDTPNQKVAGLCKREAFECDCSSQSTFHSFPNEGKILPRQEDT